MSKIFYFLVVVVSSKAQLRVILYSECILYVNLYKPNLPIGRGRVFPT